jgi:Flp pilus assembly protein TadD
MAERLDAEGVPADEIAPRLPSGRVDRNAADARFDLRRVEVEADPADWRGWYRLALAYDDAGDRRRARAAMRHAIDLFV